MKTNSKIAMIAVLCGVAAITTTVTIFFAVIGAACAFNIQVNGVDVLTHLQGVYTDWTAVVEAIALFVAFGVFSASLAYSVIKNNFADLFKR